LPWPLPRTVGCRRQDRTTAKHRNASQRTLASLDEATARFPRGRDAGISSRASTPLSLYDEAEIAAGRAELDRAIAMHGRGPYVLQAAIASLHLEPEIDWPQIAALYAKLAELTRSPVVELNRAVAIAEGGDPHAALDLVDGLELGDYRYLHSTRAELLRRLGRVEEARSGYERALPLARTEPERRFLARRLAELGSR